MPTFEYTALSMTGQRVVGVLAGPSEQAVLSELESRQLTPVAIEPKGESAVRRGRVSARALGNSYSQLSELLHAGVPLLRSLKLLGGRKSQPRLSAVFKQLADAVAEGEELGAAMDRCREVFPPVHVAMVRAGEKGGFLEAVLARLGHLVLAQAEMRSKVIGNLIYPAVLVVVGAGVLGVMFGVFVPLFRPMFETIPGGVPTITRIVFAISSAVGKYGLVTLGVLVVAGIVLMRLSRRASVRRKLVEWKTFAPVTGVLVRSLAAARFCRMLGTMLANGVPMLAAMQIAKDAAGNLVMEEAIDKAAESVRAGHTVAGPLAESGLFEEDVVEMISVGEAANNLDTVLLKIAETVEARVDRLLGTVVKLIEPVLLLGLAAVVVVIAAALILPMTQMKADF